MTDRTILTYSWFEGDRPVRHLFSSIGNAVPKGERTGHFLQSTRSVQAAALLRPDPRDCPPVSGCSPMLHLGQVKGKHRKQVTDRTILTYSWFEGDRPVCRLFSSVTCFRPSEMLFRKVNGRGISSNPLGRSKPRHCCAQIPGLPTGIGLLPHAAPGAGEGKA